MRNSGFSLIELLVALAILAIVSAIAVPLYTEYSESAYRSEAQADLLVCAQAMERFASINFTYEGAADTDADGLGDADTGPVATTICDPDSVRAGRYTIAVDADAATFSLTATPQNNMDGDGFLRTDNTGLREWDRDNSTTISADEETWED